MRSDSDRLKDILESIHKIQERTDVREDDFRRDEMLQVWVIHHLQTIGEAARGISQDLKGRYPTVPWQQLVGLRNILVHEYFGLNLKQVWMMVRKELPDLKVQIQQIRAARPSS